MASTKVSSGKTSGKRPLIKTHETININNFRFNKSKTNSNGITMTPILYQDTKPNTNEPIGTPQELFLITPFLKAPFGINTKTEIIDPKQKKKEDAPPITTGYDITLSLDKNYEEEGTESNHIFNKQKEFDEFMMNECYKNRTEWLGISSMRQEAGVREQINGVGDSHFGSMFKQTLILPRNKGKDASGIQTVRKDFPPSIKFSINVKIEKGVLEEDGTPRATWITQFFDDATGKEIKGINSSNFNEHVPKFSLLKVLVKIVRITSSKAWAVVKNEAVQIRVRRPESFPREINFLDDAEDEVSSDEDDEGLDDGINYLEDTPAVASKPKSKKLVESDDDDEEANIADFIEESTSAPKPQKPKTKIGIKQTF